MSKSELHNWECAIEKLSGGNADKMLAIAQDIYNTAYVRGKNYMLLELVELNPSYNSVKTKLKPCKDCIWADFNEREREVNADECNL